MQSLSLRVSATNLKHCTKKNNDLRGELSYQKLIGNKWRSISATKSLLDELVVILSFIRLTNISTTSVRISSGCQTFIREEKLDKKALPFKPRSPGCNMSENSMVSDNDCMALRLPENRVLKVLHNLSISWDSVNAVIFILKLQICNVFLNLCNIMTSLKIPDKNKK